MARLTYWQEEEIRASTQSNGELAKLYKSHHSTIKRIRASTSKRILGHPDGGPTTAYKDGRRNEIHVLHCEDGYIPDGWLDSPGKCKNTGERVKVA